ncbi:fibulin-2-like [Colossoma macropomum]|uniref:fibulin-2-like n=1 Tax=Colossoma macropomum TaxID=42526 RepID=UPI001864DA5A|nr:fibulin-2-like [Colossoma macropomum]
MNKQIWVQLTGISCTLLLFCLQMCLGEKDCTGVECPILENCIEEMLEEGECCATCLRRGCTCEGYQYYDCISAGFKNGKVPEGEFYLVDFGSTECSCPEGGGKIGCHFIPCPEIPANCIDLSESTESCPHCLRVGCIYRNQRYEAGHSFHMDPCQVCHCPNDGGDLMCSPIPNCDSEMVKEPIQPTDHEEKEEARNELHITKHEGPVDFPTRHHPGFPSNSLPVFTDSPSEFVETADYNYFPETTSMSKPEDSIRSSSTVRSEAQFSHDALHKDIRKELREMLGTYVAEETMNSPSPLVPATTAHQEGQTVTSKKDLVPESPHSEPETAGAQTTQRIQTERPVQSRAATHSFLDEEETANTIHHIHRNSHGTHHRGTGKHVKHSDTKLHSSSPEYTSPKTQSSPTTSPIMSLKERETPRLSQTEVQEEKEEDGNELYAEPENQGVSSRQMLSVCCEAGKTWASARGHCTNMEPTRMDPVSVCWTVQSQCCLGSLHESKCLAGLSAARAGRACGADGDDVCGTDSYKECCSCCALGLHLRRDGGHCEAPHGLGHSCSHALQTCCQGANTPNQSVIREIAEPQPTTPPRRVSDSPDRQAMSLDEVAEAENAVEKVEEIEGLQDMDECKVYEGQLCQQECINTLGSYICACFPGYTLHPDGSSCLNVTSEEENSLKELDSPTANLTPDKMPTTPPPGLPDPCEGNGPCAQRCSPVAGQPICSCFPGFSLLADGHSCEDINECLLSTHTCQTNERCVNTLGHFTCERYIACPAGYQLRSNMCEDINECTLGNHNCGAGFECINTVGSFSCRGRLRCPGGFTHDTRGQCVDIDECRTVSQPCSSGFNCVNTIGSYTCQRKIIMCGRGYHASPDGRRCIDIDECQTGVHRCGEGQLCNNLSGTYRCDCKAGYQYDTFRRMCVDVNECWRYPGRLCAQTCENTPGSYLCSCTSGFTLSSDGKNCEDVNECLNNPCSQECANVYGSFQCYCKQGYYLREDGLTCEDIDECSQSAGHLCAFKCVNVPGSYQCSCPEHGYSMSPNGRSCRDIDECALGAHNCTVGETCYNIQGGFRCLSFSCPPNYRRVSDTRCERISCTNFVECQNTPVRITYYQLSFQTNIIIPAQIFRIGPSPAYSGDNIIVSIIRGNEEGYFSTRKLNSYTGAIYLHRQVQQPRDFLVDVEMKLWRQGTFTTFLARIYVFITPNIL